VLTGYEPIVFAGGKFQIKESAYASCPELRVTGYCAAAYVRYYGKKRLPYVEELFFAIWKGGLPTEKTRQPTGGTADKEAQEHMAGMMGHMEQDETGNQKPGSPGNALSISR